MINRNLQRHLRKMGVFSVMVTLSAQMAAAAITTDDVIATYQADGFTRIEVRVGLTQMKVEAIKGDIEVETIYDLETGNILKTETDRVDAGDNTTPGVSVRERNRDFLRTSRNDDDGDDDDDDDDSDDRDDRNDRDHDDDDHDDDHGGDRRDHDSDDDHGDDHHGSDDD